MLLGALVDAGLPLEDLRAELAKLPVNGFSLEADVVHRGVIRGTLVTVSHEPRAAGAYTMSDFMGMVEGSALAAPVKERARLVLESAGGGRDASPRRRATRSTNWAIWIR